MSGLPILAYHNVDAAPQGVGLPRLYVTPEQFARQLWWLKRLGLKGISLSEGLTRLRQGNTGQYVVLTFDDGYADNLRHAAPVLKSIGFSATCYVVSHAVGTFNFWDAEKLGIQKPVMSREDLVSWLEHGMEIGSHSRSHPRFDRLDETQALEELTESRKRLTQWTGAEIRHFCYPYGAYAAETPELVKRAGYASAVTAQRGRAHASHDPYRLPRLSISGEKGLLKFLLKAATGYGDIGAWRRSA
jgi:peptidoglycan/xylan/chitin deacetylase (PgdA/CDA1 family)